MGVHDRDPLLQASPSTLTSLEQGKVYETVHRAQSFEKDGERKVYRGQLGATQTNRTSDITGT